jgi:hypothetical protein
VRPSQVSLVPALGHAPWKWEVLPEGLGT